MSKQSSYTVSRNITVTPEGSSIGITVIHNEWIYLKDQISRISVKPGLVWHTIGSILSTSSVGTVIAIFTTDFTPTIDSGTSGKAVVYWAIVIVTALLGSASFYLGYKVRNLDAARAADIIQIMKFIEQGYSLPDDTNTSKK
jgi:hypothetical protein